MEGQMIVGGVLSGEKVMVTLSELAVQGPLVMVQRNTLLPEDRPETVVVGEFAFAKVPEPETTVQVPVPMEGVFALRVAELTSTVWLAPAFAVVGFLNTVMVCVREQNPYL